MECDINYTDCIKFSLLLNAFHDGTDKFFCCVFILFFNVKKSCLLNITKAIDDNFFCEFFCYCNIIKSLITFFYDSFLDVICLP